MPASVAWASTTPNIAGICSRVGSDAANCCGLCSGFAVVGIAWPALVNSSRSASTDWCAGSSRTIAATAAATSDSDPGQPGGTHPHELILHLRHGAHQHPFGTRLQRRSRRDRKCGRRAARRPALGALGTGARVTLRLSCGAFTAGLSMRRSIRSAPDAAHRRRGFHAGRAWDSSSDRLACRRST